MSVPRSRVLEIAVDALVYGLGSIVAIRVAVDGLPLAVAGVLLAATIVAIYALGTIPQRRSGVSAAVWFALLVAAWAALVFVDVAGVYLGFALYFVALERFTARVGVALVAVVTAVIVVAVLVHQPSLGIAAVIGPIIGAAVAVAMVLGYRSLERENDHRRALIDELHETRAELAAAEHQRGVLEERERLAREIHDTVAQGLTSIVILLGATTQELAGGQVERATEHVEQARDTARTNLDEARRFVRALRPGALDDGSLGHALQRLCDSTAEFSGATVDFVSCGEAQTLPSTYEVALLRVAQSALANMTAHADAHHGQVTLTYMADAVTLDIHDDGRGFDPAGITDPSSGESGFGLIAMRQRVSAFDGTLSIESSAGQGTTIAVMLPLGSAGAIDAGDASARSRPATHGSSAPTSLHPT